MAITNHRSWRYTDACDLDNLTLPDWLLPGGPLSPEILAILYTRGFRDEAAASAFLIPERYMPSLPSELHNMEKAVRILQRLRPENRVLVWGDFDVDGQTSTAILVDALRKLDIQVDYHIPDRRRESHGVHLMVLNELIADDPPDVLLICDTGSSDNDAIEYAKSLDISVIIADHHELSVPYPRADALVNPQMLKEETHPLYTLSGAGVCYLLVEALYHALGRKSEAEAYLELAAIGLIADIVEQVQDVRYLIQRGLRQLQQSERVGINALAAQLEIDLTTITATDVAFSLAPALNAFGRLDSASTAVELLLTEDQTRAQELAAMAQSLNQKRRHITTQTVQSALEMIENSPDLLDWEAVVLSSPHWNAGIIGIVAANISEKYNKPAAILVESEDGFSRASVRSVEGYPVHAALEHMSDILLNYGGHEGAGGFSIANDNLPRLRRTLSQAFEATKRTEEPPPLTIEGIIPFNRVTTDFALELQRLAPFGEGNPNPIFVTEGLSLKSVAKLGKQANHRRLIVEDGDGQRQRVFWWNSADAEAPSGTFDLAYTVRLSTYKGERELQIEFVDWHQIQAPEQAKTSQRELLDYRHQPDFEETLQKILDSESDCVIWADGFSSSDTYAHPFSKLKPSQALIVLTTPADEEQLEKAIQKVDPSRVYFINIDSPINELSEFLKLLNGLGQRVIEAGGTVNIQLMMERLAQSKTVVRLGLEYLDALGQLDVSFGERTRIEIDKGIGEKSDPDTVESVERRLRSAWSETEAYRRYLQRIDADQLIQNY